MKQPQKINDAIKELGLEIELDTTKDTEKTTEKDTTKDTEKDTTQLIVNYNNKREKTKTTEDTTRITLRIDTNLYNQVKKLAYGSVNKFINRAVANYVKYLTGYHTKQAQVNKIAELLMKEIN